VSRSEGYPLSGELERAVALLFDDPTQGLGLLGISDESPPAGALEEPLSTDLPVEERAEGLRLRLERYVSQMADEVSELGDSEMERLRSEATGLLIALREVVRHFPECRLD